MFRKIARQFNKSRALVTQVRNNDLFIVEFPKSGITWLSTLLINSCSHSKGLDIRATMFNTEQYVGDAHIGYEVEKNLVFSDIRVIKTHEPYRSSYRHVIYLIRNPYSVMESYYRFCINNNLFYGEISDFIRSKAFGIENWVKHVESWLLRPQRQLKLHLISYENLISCPEVELSNLFTNLGWVLPKESVHLAIKNSSFDQMKKLDNIFVEANPARNYSFVRKGQKSSSELSIKDKSYIESFISDELMKVLVDKGCFQ